MLGEDGENRDALLTTLTTNENKNENTHERPPPPGTYKTPSGSNCRKANNIEQNANANQLETDTGRNSISTPKTPRRPALINRKEWKHMSIADKDKASALEKVRRERIKFVDEQTKPTENDQLQSAPLSRPTQRIFDAIREREERDARVVLDRESSDLDTTDTDTPFVTLWNQVGLSVTRLQNYAQAFGNYDIAKRVRDIVLGHLEEPIARLNATIDRMNASRTQIKADCCKSLRLLHASVNDAGMFERVREMIRLDTSVRETKFEKELADSHRENCELHVRFVNAMEKMTGEMAAVKEAHSRELDLMNRHHDIINRHSRQFDVHKHAVEELQYKMLKNDMWATHCLWEERCKIVESDFDPNKYRMLEHWYQGEEFHGPAQGGIEPLDWTNASSAAPTFPQLGHDVAASDTVVADRAPDVAGGAGNVAGRGAEIARVVEADRVEDGRGGAGRGNNQRGRGRGGRHQNQPGRGGRGRPNYEPLPQ